jgi:hypothetical protein
MTSKKLLEMARRKEMIDILTSYYKEKNRDKYPDLTLYTNHQLKLAILMFGIELKMIEK